MSDREALIERCREYLASGGLFNPELANNEAVRDLIIDLRDAVAAQQKDDPVATDSYVQPVPDHCDRITWRGQYFHLPLADPPEQQKVEPVAWLYSFFLPGTGKFTQYASVCNHERRDEITDAEWDARKVMPLYAAPPTDAEGIRLLREAQTELHHALNFISSREKMAPVGIELYNELLERIDAYLAKYPGA